MAAYRNYGRAEGPLLLGLVILKSWGRQTDRETDRQTDRQTSNTVINYQSYTIVYVNMFVN